MILSNISVSGPLKIQTLLYLAMTAKVNDHIYLHLRGIVDEAASRQVLNQQTSGDGITVTHRDSEKEVLIFSGFPLSANIRAAEDYYEVDMVCVGHTYKLDTERHSRSFQYERYTYDEVVEKLLTGSDGSSIVTNGDAQIGTPVVQYQETDWSLLKRLASRVGTVLVANALADHPQFSFGLPKRKLREITPESYAVACHTERYQQDLRISEVFGIRQLPNTQLKSGGVIAMDGCRRLYKDKKLSLEDTISRNEYLCYSVEGCEDLQLGDYVLVENTPLYVMETSLELTSQSTEHRAILGRERGFACRCDMMPQYMGLKLQGTVLKAEGQLLKVQLDIDGKQKASEAHWYPYHPIVDNGMYCMPQEGTKVMLCMDDPYGNMTALHCCRENGGENETDNDNNSFFTTEHLKRLAMLPDTLIATNYAEEIRLHDRQGITITTPYDIELDATNSIIVMAKQICLTSPEAIAVRHGYADNIIEMQANGIQISSPQTALNTVGTNQIPYPEHESIEPMELKTELSLLASGTTRIQ